MTWTIFVLLKATPQWLAHSIEQRASIANDCLHHSMTDDRVTMRFYDAEAFSGTCSDLAVFETTDLQAYYFVMERVRSTPMFSAPYFEVIEIIPAVENGYQSFQQAEKEVAQ